MKCLLAFFVLAFVFVVNSVSVEAKTKTEKLTLFKGEKVSYYYIGLGSIKSVKSNKSNVVSVKKKNGSVYMTAKKTGSAKVTVKGSRGTYVHKITVKNATFDVKLDTLNENYLLVTVKNKTAGYFDSVDIDFTFRDANNNVIGEKKAYISAVGSKKTGYDTISTYNIKNADLSKVNYKITFYRNVDSKYKNYDKQVKYSDTKSGNYVKLTTKSSYKGNGGIYAGFTVFFYDASGKLINIYDGYNYLYKNKKSQTVDIYIPSGVVTYKVVKRVYLKS